MALITQIMDIIFGQKNVLAETAHVFRENAENQGQRRASLSMAALAQFASEFSNPRRNWFDTVIDGLNRLPRPALAFGTIGLLISAMVSPDWFVTRMSGLALVPEPLWWLLGAIISFYFGARHQAKGQDFQRAMARSLAQALPRDNDASEGLRTLQDSTATTVPNEKSFANNPALQEWKRNRGD